LQNIEGFVREEGMTVIPDFVGHGIGKDFHSMPNVEHTANDSHDLMKPGMAFTIGLSTRSSFSRSSSSEIIESSNHRIIESSLC